MTSWLIYPLSIADQQVHIDQSERFLKHAQPGDPPILYWSIADPGGIVLGFSQKASVLNPQTSHTLPIYHRHAGGTAVLVGPGLLSLDVILPAGHPLILADVVESYRWFGDAWVQTLQTFNIETRTVPPEEAHAQQALRRQDATREYELLLQRACYGSLSPYEVVSGKRKLVGFDMVRRRAGSLLQAGLLLQWDTSHLAHILGHTPEEQACLREGLLERAVGLDTLSGNKAIGINTLISTFEKVVLSSPG